MRVFVAGGSGVLGRRVVRRLADAGHEVRATSRGPAAAEQIRAAGASPVEVDLFDEDAVRRAVDGCAAVLRLTTKIPSSGSIGRASAWQETGRLRNESARVLAEACVAASVPLLLHESMAFVYADGGDRWLHEDAPTDDAGTVPLRDALNGEANARIVTDAGGRGIVLRFAALYGADSVQSLEMATRLQRRRYALVGPSRNYFSTVHLDDAASATVAALRAPAGVYNVADGNPLQLREYLAAVAAAIDAPPMRRLPRFFGRLALGETWKYMSRSLRVSPQRLHDATGWTPTIADARIGWKHIATEWVREMSQ